MMLAVTLGRCSQASLLFVNTTVAFSQFCDQVTMSILEGLRKGPAQPLVFVQTRKEEVGCSVTKPRVRTPGTWDLRNTRGS